MSTAPTDQQKLNQLASQALDHAVSSIKEGGGPLIPFSIIDTTSGERKLTRYAVERLEEAESKAKTHIASLKASIIRYACAWDGFVTMKGERSDALFVEAGDGVADAGLLLCQKYTKKGIFRKSVVPIGIPSLIERPTSLIK